MELPHTMETEELMTYLQIQLYHPQQASKALYRLLPLDARHKHPAEDPLRLGRDAHGCTFALADPRVSRKQLALQAYLTANSPDMLFSVQNLSQKGHVTVNGSELRYLERAELPNKALVRFGEYELLIRRENGEAKGSFEVEFGVLAVPPSREVGVPSIVPVMDTGSDHSNNGIPPLMSHGPIEMDETIMYQSCSMFLS
ncbi:TRAF-interacting protein with FHA domain-containing protein A [Oncorhynchus tshawytscha]|uniref:TRAF-interacting protein with FHA domain-containing protein A n=1 Tax=Oncorhynchus tshawytscha TaxID=74940 RepID=A0AAZ3Q5E0_ONCTS|nr:TRAF-interacting protein with FHA domain-containing protein A [Oncorhynchus tshawytscha]XP_042154212.1 TRAF-interacting protein with FHA domain-containing protein A [Oncorhynchus tshawytscha]